MKHYVVEFSPEAQAHVELIASWWERNRGAAPALFREELTAAIDRLASSPATGAPYQRLPPVRRLLMPRCRYHIYYSLDEAACVVEVHAIWHCARGRNPSL